ncbi:MAG: alpha/beta hydrolase [Rhodoferax sp.]|nr:alpha/beta hydrolase [Rhodoferax sp.]
MRWFLTIFASVLLAQLAVAQTPNPIPGIVVMHGKGGSPTRLVNELAGALESHTYRVANLEMPWSGRREYDAGVDAAVQEVDAAIRGLRERGAVKIFVAGHSQGGLFALFYSSRHAVDGVIAIAPGGDPTTTTPREKLAGAVQQARVLVAQGKGGEKAQLADYEGSKGITPVETTPAIYMSWFDPEGELGMATALKRIPATVPVLYIAPTNDYPALVRINPSLFKALALHPLTQFYEPNATHMRAPTASISKILEWTRAVSTAP